MPPKVNFENDTCINSQEETLFSVLFTHEFSGIFGGSFLVELIPVAAGEGEENETADFAIKNNNISNEIREGKGKRIHEYLKK